MMMKRREFLAASVATVTAISAAPLAQTGGPMYGLIGKMITAPGKRDEFIAILGEGIGNMPGCLSYIIAKDPADENAIWITEAWDSETSHAASLSLPQVKEAIAKGRPMIAGFGERFITTPVGGHGLIAPKAR